MHLTLSLVSASWSEPRWMLASLGKVSFPENVADDWILHHWKGFPLIRLRKVVFPVPWGNAALRNLWRPSTLGDHNCQWHRFDLLLANSKVNHNQVLLLKWAKEYSLKKLEKLSKFNLVSFLPLKKTGLIEIEHMVCDFL